MPADVQMPASVQDISAVTTLCAAASASAPSQPPARSHAATTFALSGAVTATYTQLTIVTHLRGQGGTCRLRDASAVQCSAALSPGSKLSHDQENRQWSCHASGKRTRGRQPSRDRGLTLAALPSAALAVHSTAQPGFSGTSAVPTRSMRSCEAMACCSEAMCCAKAPTVGAGRRWAFVKQSHAPVAAAACKAERRAAWRTQHGG